MNTGIKSISQQCPRTSCPERRVQEKIKKPLAEQLLFGGLQGGGHIFITVRDGALVVGSDEKELEGADAL